MVKISASASPAGCRLAAGASAIPAAIHSRARPRRN